MDFGGGVGAYLTSFRDAGLTELFTVEPHDLGNCLFKGLQHMQRDFVNTPLADCPKDKFDLVMSIEVLEHIPVNFHGSF